MSKPKAPALHHLAAELSPVRTEGLTERLVEHMQTWIARGVVAPGDRLPPERELAATLNVSRSSLRQALKVLQAMGILEAKQGSGTYLTASADTILRQPADLLLPLRGVSFGELFEARRAMESEAAAAAAIRATARDVMALREILGRMESHLCDTAAYFAADVAFHARIAQASGNSVFVWLNDMIGTVTADAWRRRAEQGDTERTFAEHAAILAAIEQREPEEARTAMLKHLTLAKFYSHEPAPVELRVTMRRDAIA